MNGVCWHRTEKNPVAQIPLCMLLDGVAALVVDEVSVVSMRGPGGLEDGTPVGTWEILQK